VAAVARHREQDPVHRAGNGGGEEVSGSRRSRRGLALGLAALTLLLSGCVYLRLLEIKQQLGKFDEFFTLQTHDGLALVCQTPVLRTSDIRWIGLGPEKIKTLGHAQQWQVRWIKQLPQGVTEKTEFDIVLEMTFADDKLSRIAIPERYFAVMPKAFLVGVIKSLGRGKIDKMGKKIEAQISAAEIAAARPNLPAIDKLLGVPSEERVEGTSTVVRYRYTPVTKESRAGVFDMHLTFDTNSGELLKWQGFTPVGKIGFDFSGDRRK
jgi:hypothetical protein